jgi:hypothetical protein
MTVFKGVVAGLALAAVTIVIGLALPAGKALLLLAVLLGLIAGVYVGFVIPSQRSTIVLTEGVAALAFVALAAAAPFTTHGIGILAIGYFLHGAWDLAHHPGPLPGAPHWYAGSCVAYDVVIGAFILLAFP